jgi:hypothetical protein
LGEGPEKVSSVANRLYQLPKPRVLRSINELMPGVREMSRLAGISFELSAPSQGSGYAAEASRRIRSARAGSRFTSSACRVSLRAEVLEDVQFVAELQKLVRKSTARRLESCTILVSHRWAEVGFC